MPSGPFGIDPDVNKSPMTEQRPDQSPIDDNTNSHRPAAADSGDLRRETPDEAAALLGSQPRGFIFWSLAPLLVVFLVLMPILVPNRDPGTMVVLGGVEAAALALLLGLWNPHRFWWAWRALGAIVFLVYLAYAVAMFVEGRFFGKGRRAETTLFNALLGMIAFGLPGLWYAIFGRLTWRKEPMDFDDGMFDDEDDESDHAVELDERSVGK